MEKGKNSDSRRKSLFESLDEETQKKIEQKTPISSRTRMKLGNNNGEVLPPTRLSSEEHDYQFNKTVQEFLGFVEEKELQYFLRDPHGRYLFERLLQGSISWRESLIHLVRLYNGLLKEMQENILARPTATVEALSVSDFKNLIEWLSNPQREIAQTKFTSGPLRDLAREIEYQIQNQKP